MAVEHGGGVWREGVEVGAVDGVAVAVEHGGGVQQEGWMQGLSTASL